MKHYLRLFARTFGISVSTMLIYRANLVFFVIFESLFLASQFLTVHVGYKLAGSAIAGWTEPQAYLLTAVNGLSHQLFICFFINPIFSLAVQVWNGQYDYVLLKPLHPLLSMLFTAQFVTSNLPNLLTNVAFVVYFLATNPALDMHMLPAFLLLTTVGVAVRIALALVCISPVFLSERLADAENTFWSVSSLGRFPMAVYPRVMELVLTFVIPVGMLASVPASSLYHGLGTDVLAGAAFASVLFAAFGVWVFMRMLGKYQSVNSGV
jgi:ABC-2 type transport system permease protein